MEGGIKVHYAEKSIESKPLIKDSKCRKRMDNVQEMERIRRRNGNKKQGGR